MLWGNSCIDTMLAEKVVDELEILIGDIDAILVQQLVYLDEVHPATWFETGNVSKYRGCCGTGSSQIARSNDGRKGDWHFCALHLSRDKKVSLIFRFENENKTRFILRFARLFVPLPVLFGIKIIKPKIFN